MGSDYAYRYVVMLWARCLLEWVTVCKTAAIVHEGSSPSALIVKDRNLSGCMPAVRRSGLV